MTPECIEKWRTNILGLIQNDLNKAVHESNVMVTTIPDDSASWATRSYVRWASGDREGGLDDISHAIYLSPSEPANLFQKGDYLVSMGLFQEAIEPLSRSITSGLDNEFSYYSEVSYAFRALCYCKIGLFENASHDLNNVSRVDPIWIDKLRTKEELLIYCEKNKMC